MYDPYLGRFLSPDNYVQMPDANQSFNRYSYCFNNPLIYSDQDGEWVQIVFGAIMGGINGYLIADAKGEKGWNKFWYTIGGVVIGAASSGIGSAISSGGGSAFLAGAFAGGIGNAGMATLAGSDPCRAFVNGFIAGGVGGWVGSSIGGGMGAFFGGAIGGGLNTALNNGNSNDVIKSIILGGMTSYTMYHAVSYYNFEFRGGKNLGEVKLKYNTYNKLNALFTRSRFLRNEHDLWIMNDGTYEKVESDDVIHTRISIERTNIKVPSNAKYYVHTHFHANGWIVKLYDDGLATYANPYSPSDPADYHSLNKIQKDGIILTNRNIVKFYSGTTKYNIQWSYPLVRYFPSYFWW